MSSPHDIALVVSNAAVPRTALALPSAFSSLLVPGKATVVLSAGNVGKEPAGFLRSLATRMAAVRGDCELSEASLPETRVITLGAGAGAASGGRGVRVGIVGGHQVTSAGDISALAQVALALDADILVYGGAKQSAVEHRGRAFVCPGSLSYSSTSTTASPSSHPSSFTLLSVNDEAGFVDIFMYRAELGSEEVSVERAAYVVGGQTPFSPTAASSPSSPSSPSSGRWAGRPTASSEKGKGAGTNSSSGLDI
jgi:predicted phosphodiesterase